MKSLNWRMIVIVSMTIWALYASLPTFIYFAQPNEVKSNQEVLKSKIPSYLPQKFVNLGLDLQGGVQLVLGVDVDEAIENKLGRISTEVNRWAKDNKKPIESSYILKGEKQLRVTLTDLSKSDTTIGELKNEFPGIVVTSKKDNNVDFSFEEGQIKGIKDSALEQAVRVVRTRVDKWGVAEPLVARRADKTILVQLPGFSDPKKAKELLGRTAQLKFQIVDDEFTALNQLEGKLPEGVFLRTAQSGRQKTFYYLESENAEAIRAATEGLIPADRELLLQREVLADGKKSRFLSHVVYASTELTGEDVLDANVGQSSSRLDGSPAVHLRFTGPGGKRFADITGENVNRAMAIVLDQEVVSAPNIQSKISGGSAEIAIGSGNYQKTLEEAQQLSLVLKSGALPATIQILEERQVGASLGPELATQGIESILLGLALVFLFMIVIYRRPGVIACIALALNGLFLMALMGALGFALTLPGIAGFILTLGMAVDANVLINERIKQELDEGKNARNAVANGFGKVFWTIMDSNITTLIAALVLLETNASGPIRGFAVTLIIGLIVSLFTSLYCSKEFFRIALKNKTSDQDIRKWLGDKPARIFKFNFFKMSMPVATIAAAIAIGALVLMFSKGGLNWSVDFAGGSEIEVAFEKDVNPSQIRAAADIAKIENLELQRLDSSDKKYVLRFDNKSATEQSIENNSTQSLQKSINEQLAEFKPTIQRVDYVGPKVGQSLRNQGFKSAFLAIICVIAYIFLRFDIIFGPGALTKILVDTTMVLAFYIFAWQSFDLTSVAALLTIIGYSVNDTIVIFDRVRENLTTFPRRDLKENVNISLNETLTRGINTSLVTILSLLGILVYGTAQIWSFAAAMTIGVLSASITSVFISPLILVAFHNFKKKTSAAT